MAKFGPGAQPVRPMPNPRLNPAVTPMAAPATGGFLGPKGSEFRYDMATQLIGQAMAGAQSSGNPLAAFLAPIAGSVIGARATKQREEAKAAEAASMTEALLGPAGMSPDARRALEVLQNENAPDYLQALAQKQFAAAMAPATGGGGGGRRRSSGGGGGSKPRPRLYGETVTINGVPGKYDGTGQWWPLVGPDGSSPTDSGAPAAPVAPPPPADPAIPSDPSGYTLSPEDELLLKKYGG